MNYCVMVGETAMKIYEAVKSEFGKNSVAL
jgi:hypothetical protein